jgi:hypothetical protein
MQEFVRMAAAVLGTTEQAVRGATSGVLDLVARVAPAADVQALLSRLPGAAELLNAVRTPPPPPPPPPGSAAAVMGAVSDIVGNAATAVQGALGTGVAVLGLLGQFGLDPGKAVEFLRLFVGFARQQAGPEVVDRAIAAVPGLTTLIATIAGGRPGGDETA